MARFDTDKLKRRFTAAAALALAGAPTGCATDAEGRQSEGVTPASRFVQGDVSAQLCEAWLSGRADRVCLTRLEAAAKAVAQATTEAGCPTSVKVAPGSGVVAKPVKKVRSRRKPQPKTMLLLAATTASASSDCGQSTCCYVAMDRRIERPQIMRGRPLLDARGEAHVAPLFGAQGAADILVAIRLKPQDDFTSQELAFAHAHWLEAASYEHASIGSFARAAAELVAAGAPETLVTDCWIAAIDEARHAAICLAVARVTSVDDSASEFGAMPPLDARPGGLADLAVRVFEEGCIGESTAALEAVRASSGCVVEDIREALDEIAVDEARHAALAWRTVGWAIAKGGIEVAQAVQRAGERYVLDLTAARPSGGSATNGAPRLGALSGQAQWHIAMDAWRGVIEPTLWSMLPEGGSAA